MSSSRHKNQDESAIALASPPNQLQAHQSNNAVVSRRINAASAADSRNPNLSRGAAGNSNLVLANLQSYNLMDKKRNGNFLTQMYHEVIFRKQNDSNFDYLTRNQTRKRAVAKNQSAERSENRRS